MPLTSTTSSQCWKKLIYYDVVNVNKFCWNPRADAVIGVLLMGVLHGLRVASLRCVFVSLEDVFLLLDVCTRLRKNAIS